MAADSHFLIVGVDYGTTFSGASYVFSDKTCVGDIEILDQWGSGDFHQKQVPSRIAYHPRMTWGYDIEPGQSAYCWTKLLLDKDAPMTDHDDEGLRGLYGKGFKSTEGSSKSAGDIVTDYLGMLYNRIMSELERKISKSILNFTPIKFWFTYPALWSLKAQNSTRKAAKKAGFGSRVGDEIHLIKEPEAAAIACLNMQVSSGPHPLIKKGKAVLVCDCGGGTVDLASYEVVKDHPLQLNQACVSEGGKCGSTAIDRGFMELMDTRFGAAFRDVPLQKRNVSSRFMADFESAKRDFSDPQLSRTHRLRLKMKVDGSEYYDDEDDEVKLKTSDLKTLFDPVVEKIMALIQEQISATESRGLSVVTIVLVGGFGESRYLYNRIYKEWTEKGIAVINPAKSWEAVCLGAAFRGLKGPVVLKKMTRSHLGHPMGCDFREGIDAEADSYLDLWTGRKMSSNYMQWLVSKEAIITPETEIRFTFYRTFDQNTSRVLNYDIYESGLSVAPEKLDHFSIIRVGTIERDFRSLDFNLLPTKKLADGTDLYRVDYELIIIPEGDLGYMHFRIESQGQVVGVARLKLEGES